MTTFDGGLDVTEELLEKMPTPGEIRQRLSIHLQAVDLLKRLLKLSERNERVYRRKDPLEKSMTSLRSDS